MPQNCGELVYSQPWTPPNSNSSVSNPSVAYGKINIKRAEFANDARPLDETCGCYCCENFSRAYLRHLYMAGEILSSQLNSLHNLYFYQRLMDKCREAIRVGRSELWPQWLEAETLN